MESCLMMGMAERQSSCDSSPSSLVKRVPRLSASWKWYFPSDRSKGGVYLFRVLGYLMDVLSKERSTIMLFHVKIERDEYGWLVAECPALPGCVGQGKDEQEALENIKEAI
jgi:hypothetical protein